MRYCPNAECSFAKKFGRAGEYGDQATSCSDCGAALTEVAPATRVEPEVVKPSDANRRLAVTLGGACAYVALARIPVMGMPESVFGGGELPPLMMLAVGMTPFMSAFMFLELLALVVPPLRPLRVGGAKARARLDRFAWSLGFVLLAVQLAGVFRYTQTLVALPPPHVLWPQVVLAHLAMLGLGVLVTRAGLGNGFALLMAVGFLVAFLETGRGLYAGVLSEAIAPAAVLLLVVTLGVAAALSMRLARTGRPRGEPRPSTAPAPVGGTIGWSWAAAVIALPATLSAWLAGFEPVQRALQSSQALYFGVFLFVAIDVSLLMGFLFFRPESVGALWAKWVPGVDRTGVIAAARALLPRALALSLALTVGLPFLLMVAGQWLSIPLGGTGGLLVVVISLAVADVQDEWRALRRLGPLTSVYEVQRTAEVEPIIHLLRTAGIEAHARSFFLRTTQQFFAPWIPVSILVPEARAEEARALLAK